jgi:hypothetical protein
MPEPNDFDEPIREIVADQKRQWLSGRRVLLESYLPRHPRIAQSEEPLLDLIYHEVRLRESMDEAVAAADYLRRFPQLKDQIEPLFQVHSAMASAFPESTLAFDVDASRAAVLRRIHWPGSMKPLAVVDESLEQYLIHRGVGDDAQQRLGAIFYYREPPVGREPRAEFRLLREAARSGAAIVYQALERVTHRTIAVKTLLYGPFAAGGELDARVARLREISHPHLAAVLGSGEHHGLPYVAMEYADCGSLAERLQIGACDARQTSRLAQSLAAGLSALHDAGLAHGNLKPSNVLLTAEGAWKLSDMYWTTCLPDVLNLGCIVERPAATCSLLELAKELRGQIGLHPPCGVLRTTVGWRMADVRYLAPEAASADYAGPSPAEDIYALGAILYELLAGRAAFGGESLQEIWSRVLSGLAAFDALTASGAPPNLQEICLACLAKQPVDRPSLHDLAAVLAECG